MRNVCHEADGVQRPEVIVASCGPETLWCDGLTIVHIALGRVITENAVDDNFNLALSEPTLWPEPSLGLDSGSRHEKEGGETD